MSARRIKTTYGALALLVAVVVSLGLIWISSFLSTLPQLITFMVGMILLWYVAHPLAHLIVASANGISVRYFYLGRTELSKAFEVAKPVSKYVLTIGTKLDTEKFHAHPRSTRALVMGSGVITSTTVSALVLIYAFVGGLGVYTVILGGLFFIITLATEILYSTKSGDLKKMKDQMQRTRA